MAVELSQPDAARRIDRHRQSRVFVEFWRTGHDGENQLSALGYAYTARIPAGHRAAVRRSRERPELWMERRQHNKYPRSEQSELSGSAARHPGVHAANAASRRRL